MVLFSKRVYFRVREVKWVPKMHFSQEGGGGGGGGGG